MDGASSNGGPSRPNQAQPIEQPPDEGREVAGKEPVTTKIPHRIMLYGDGLHTWDKVTFEHFMQYNESKTPEQVKNEATAAMEENGVYYAEAIMDGQAIMILRNPQKVKKKEDVKIWLEWWTELLRRWKEGRITALISPSVKYDPIVKMTAGVIKANYLLQNPETTRATSKYDEHKSLRALMANRASLIQASGQEEDVQSLTDAPGSDEEEHSDSGDARADQGSATPDEESRSDTDSDSEDEAEQENPEQGGEEEDHWSPYASDGNLALPDGLTNGLTPTLKRVTKLVQQQGKGLAVQRRLLERSSSYHGPERSAPKKRKEKKNHQEDEPDSPGPSGDEMGASPRGFKRGRDDRLQPLNPLPEEKLKIFGQGGIRVYHWIGSPWEIDGDGLLIFADVKLKIYNGNFRKNLVGQAGEEYQREVRERQVRGVGETTASRRVIVTSGGRLPYYAVLHLPIQPYQGAGTFPRYQEEMLETLERGVDRARDLQLRRVVICTDGLRSHHMHWEQAEGTAMALVKLILRMPGMWGTLQEIVIVTSKEQHQDRKQRALASVQRSDYGERQPRSTSEPRLKLTARPQEETEGRVVRSMSWQGAGTQPRSPRQPEQRVKDGQGSPLLLNSASTQRSNQPRGSPEKAQPERQDEENSDAEDMEEDQEKECPPRRSVGYCSPPGPKVQRTTPPRYPVLDQGAPESRVNRPEEQAEEVEDWGSLSSIAVQNAEEYRELRTGRRKGEKKGVEIFNIHQTSGRMARDVEWGPLETKDKRQAYVPEANQMDYEIPESWRGRGEEKLELKVTATIDEWACILMMPTYPTLVACKDLTSNFRQGYMAVAHDVMLRRMKKAAVAYSRKIWKEMQEGISTDEEEAPQTQLPLKDLKTEPKVESNMTKIQTTGHEFQEFKKLKTLIRGKRPEESTKEYLKEVWRLVEGSTDNDGGMRLWLSHVTSQPIDKSEPARKNFERLVLDDIDDEDAHIATARSGLDQGQTLTQVWHQLKQVITPQRYVKALRMVTSKRAGEITFVKMPVSGTTVPQMDAAVRSWDLEHEYYVNKRKREQGQQGGQAKNQARTETAPQNKSQQGSTQQAKGAKKDGYVSKEEWNKMTPDQRKALLDARKAAGTGGPAK